MPKHPMLCLVFFTANFSFASVYQTVALRDPEIALEYERPAIVRLPHIEEQQYIDALKLSLAQRMQATQNATIEQLMDFLIERAQIDSMQQQRHLLDRLLRSIEQRGTPLVRDDVDLLLYDLRGIFQSQDSIIRATIPASTPSRRLLRLVS